MIWINNDPKMESLASKNPPPIWDQPFVVCVSSLWSVPTTWIGISFCPGESVRLCSPRWPLTLRGIPVQQLVNPYKTLIVMVRSNSSNHSNHTKTEWNGTQIPKPMEVWKDGFLLLKRWIYLNIGCLRKILENLVKVFKIWEFGQ